MTFGDDLGEAALKPGTGGLFEVRLDGERLWNKKDAGRSPDPKEIKQLIRDRVAPENFAGSKIWRASVRPKGAGQDGPRHMDLGHSGR